MITAPKTIEPHRRFSYDGAMNKQLDRKAWKAARKAGLTIHKVPRLAKGSDQLSVFVVCVQDKNGKITNFRDLFTVEQVIKESQKTEHDTFEFGDLFGDLFNFHGSPRSQREPTEIEIAEAQERLFAYKVDLPCVSSGA